MRILFIEELFSGSSIRAEPLSIMQLSSILKEHGHETDLVDLLSTRNIKKKIEVFNPNILAYSVRTGFHRKKFELNRLIKKTHKNIFSIFGGSHATFFPQCIREEGVDAICIGEGELALLELCNCLEQGKDITSIANLWVKSVDRIYTNEVRPLVENLDSLPILDRRILYQYKHKRDFPVKTIITQRGCPFSCSYCYNSPMRDIYAGKGNYLRRYSPNRVLQDLENIRRYSSLKYVFFEDDVFTFDKEWNLTFLDMYKRTIGAPFTAYTHVRYLDKEIIDHLKYAGCNMVGIAIECADSDIREKVLNRYVSAQEIESACSMLRDSKIRFGIGNILGIPGSNINNDIDTLRLNIKLKPDFAVASLAYPFPGTPLAKIAKKKGYKISDFDDFCSMRYPKSMINIESADEVERLQALFDIAVAFPFMARFIRLLIKLPLNVVYYMFAKVYKSYTYRWVFKMKLSLKEICTLIQVFLHYIRRIEI